MILQRREGRITVPECIPSLDRQQCWQLLHLFVCTTQQVPTTPNIVGQGLQSYFESGGGGGGAD